MQPVWAGHPWVYAEAVAHIEGSAEDGDIVDVVDEWRNFLGRGFYSSRSAIGVRILSRSRSGVVDDAFIRAAVHRAVERRRSLMGMPDARTTGFRLVNAEGDGLPGLIVDRYADVVVVQFAALGMKRREHVVLDALGEMLRPRAMIEMGDEDFQRIEGFTAARRTVRGQFEPPVVFEEAGTAYAVDPLAGQKTGFYFDQRENRRLLARLAKGKRVLDLFCYVGGFGIAAARAGAAEVDGVDSSATALLAAQNNAELNRVADRVRFHGGNARRFLVQAAEARRTWDVVVLDPPKFARRTGDVRKALTKAYAPLNAAAMRVVAPGGLLVTCSCSGRVRPDHFLRMLGMAAGTAGREARLLALRGAGPDHPVPPSFTEGQYLKCAFLEVGPWP